MDPTQEMFRGLKDTFQRMTDLQSAVQALQELDVFRQKVGEFGGEMAMNMAMDHRTSPYKKLFRTTLFCALFEYIAYILGCTCSVLVEDVRIKHSKAAVPCHGACFTMLFVQWMRAELEYFCLAAYKGSQLVVVQET